MSGNLTILRKLIDEAGRAYGYPSERTILVEVSSHIRKSDILIFKKKSELYCEKTGDRAGKTFSRNTIYR